MLLTPISDGGYGDFLNLALMDAPTGIGLERPVTTGGEAFGTLSQSLQDFQLELIHIGYTELLINSLGDSSGLETVAAPSGVGSLWYAYWKIFRDPTTNPHQGPITLGGDYAGEALFFINFQ